MPERNVDSLDTEQLWDGAAAHMRQYSKVQAQTSLRHGMHLLSAPRLLSLIVSVPVGLSTVPFSSAYYLLNAVYCLLLVVCCLELQHSNAS